MEYVTLKEGEYEGASYRIKNTEVVEDENGKSIMKFDYDVRDLTPGKEQEFEHFLGQMVVRAIEMAIDEDKGDKS